MDLKAFAIELVAKWREHYGHDIAVDDFQDLAIEHGLLVERPVTAQEAAEEDFCTEWEVVEGDLVMVDSPEFAALRQRIKEDAGK